MESKKPPKKSGHSDHFQTPDWAVDAIIPYISDWGDRNVRRPIVWESAQGSGNILRRLIDHEFNVVGTDIMHGFDFLSPLMMPPDCDIIVTNPPFSIKDQWLQRCYDLGKPFALLLPITALGEQERFKMYKKYGIEVLLLPRRVDFETPSGQGSGSWFYAAWFCHKLLPQPICFSD